MTMDNPFFEHPVLKSPYSYPSRHWELDGQGQPTLKIIEHRRRAEFITPIPKSGNAGAHRGSSNPWSSKRSGDFPPGLGNTIPPR